MSECGPKRPGGEPRTVGDGISACRVGGRARWGCAAGDALQKVVMAAKTLARTRRHDTHSPSHRHTYTGDTTTPTATAVWNTSGSGDEGLTST